MDESRHRRIRTGVVVLCFIVVLFVVVVYWGNNVLIRFENSAPSESIGTKEHGSLVNGKRLPSRGPNYIAYSYIGTLLGRNSVNSAVRDTVVDAYARLEKSHPDITFVYGETGWPHGGRIRPHATHQNGLSVDFMVPVLDWNGRSIRFPATIFNKYGYGIEFDSEGTTADLRIDFEAIAAHLLALQDAAREHGLSIMRVIFAPDLQPLLFKAPSGRTVEEQIQFLKNPSPVRHDDHYHVDFIPSPVAPDTADSQ